MSKRRHSPEPSSSSKAATSSRTFDRKFCFSPESCRGVAEDFSARRRLLDLVERKLVELVVSEEVDIDYSCYTWASAAVMAQYIWFRQEEFLGKTVLEISSGTAVPGILAAKLGASVILSEYALNPSAIRRCKAQAERNQVSVKIIGVIWGTITYELAQLQNVDFILLSDVFYEPSHFEDVVCTIRFLLQRHPNAVCLSTYQIRDEKWSLHFLLDKWKLKAKRIDLNSFDADRNDIAGSHLPGCVEIELYQFFLGKDNLSTTPVLKKALE